MFLLSHVDLYVLCIPNGDGKNHWLNESLNLWNFDLLHSTACCAVTKTRLIGCKRIADETTAASSSSDGSLLADEDHWEGWWSVLTRSLVAVETDSWCALLPHFGQAKVWDEDGRDAARSFCLLRFSFEASCLSASNSQLAFLTDERQQSRSEASCCHDWWLIPACASSLFSWSL